MTHDRRLQLWALLGALPALVLAVLVLLRPLRNPYLATTLVAACAAAAWSAARSIQVRVQRPLQTLSNLLAAIREGDYSFRAREPRDPDALGAVYRELNILSELLQQQRLKAMEATALLRAVMAEVDVAVFAFDGAGILRLANRAGAGLLALPQERLLGRPAGELGLAEALDGDPVRIADMAFPGRSGRFDLRRGGFRQGGRVHQLLVLSDLTRPLREEERRVWHGVIRVLGHEINNSLAPIQSLAESLIRILERQDDDWMSDARQGLNIIGSRAQGLGQFMEGYTRLARLPEPRKSALDLEPLIRRVAGLEQRAAIRIEPGPAVALQADGDQIAQALINLLRNAVEAAEPAQVQLGWSVTAQAVEIRVEDRGPGLPTGGNLFVPFFTTKSGGSGIGLVLSRQIAEAHGGSLVLANREDGAGARAVLRLPIPAAEEAPAGPVG
jgi:nitrogen fixation/metabolism regulation signal transduction histidine kinase